MINPSDPTSHVDREQIDRYLDLIYPPDYGWRGQISVAHSLPDGTGMPSGRWPRGRATAGAVELAESGARRGAPGVYLRCSTVRADLALGKRGGAGDSVELPGLWADLDIEGPGHKHDPEKHHGLVLAPTMEAALGIITASGLPWPTVVVHSGGGLYAWWLASQPIQLDATGRDRWGRPVQHWAAISEAWQAKLAEGARSLGYHYGPVGNLDRVLGLVGTVNAKVSDQPRMRVVILPNPGSGERFAPEELAQVAGAEYAGPGAVGRPTLSATPAPGTSGVPKPRALTPGTWNGQPDAPLAPSSVREAGHVSPLEEFEARHTWAEILIPKGWALVRGDAVAGGYCEWRHAGATHPLSATTGKDPARDRMFNFSTSVGLPVNEPMTKGYVYAQLWHGGDMQAAARGVMSLGYGTVAQNPGGQEPTGDLQQGVQPRHLELVAASGMGGPKASRWLWAEAGAHFLPLGGLCLLGGREGVGKTTWTYRLIAQLTRGTLTGDLEGQPRSAVIAATEDSWEHTIIPRLMAAGADLDRVYRIDAVEPDRRTGVSLPDDLAALGALLASQPEIGLLVLDPIITVLSAKLDSHKDHEVRKALEPISALAHGSGITVLGLIHDNKSSGNDLSTRLMGSRAFVAVARAALVCTEERDEPDEGQVDDLGADPVTVDQATEPVPASTTGPARVFLLGQVKNNLEARVGWSIRYRIGAVTVAHDESVGKDVRGSHIIRIGRQTAGLEEIVRAQERAGRYGGTEPRTKATAGILAELWDGEEHASAEIKAFLTEDGYSLRTIMRAAGELTDSGKIIATKRGREVYWRVAKADLTSPPTPLPIGDTVGMDGMCGTDGTNDTRLEATEVSGKGEGFTEANVCHVPRATSPRAREELAHVDGTGDGCQCGAALPAGQHLPWCTAGRVTA